jgi:TRAP-type C4-dicarboxylate transport system permease small subunit
MSRPQSIPQEAMGSRSASVWLRSLARLNRVLAKAMDFGALLVLPVSLLLFLQWPLRDLVQAYSREANDLAQVMFALYVSLALTQATRQGTHLATDALARHLPQTLRRRIARLAPPAVLIPWSLFILAASASSVWESLRQLEGFPDTYNPGYFLVKAGLWLLALTVLLQALIDGFGDAQRNG